MEVWKKIAKVLLFPPLAICVLLLPIATVFLVYSLTFLTAKSIVAIVSYALSFYTLTVWCARIPKTVLFFKSFKDKNKLLHRWREDVRLRVIITLYGSFAVNCAYAIFQLWLGLYHASFWYYTMAGYYILLALMRLFLVRYSGKYKQGEKMRAELQKYRGCGCILLVMNLTVSVMVFFMVYWDRTFVHHEITTIAMATYTFTALTTAIVNTVKFRKYQSPVFSAAKAISLAAASVSMITLTSTMLTTFGQGEDVFFRKVMLACLGGAVCLFIVLMAVYMIVGSTNRLKMMKKEEGYERRK